MAEFNPSSSVKNIISRFETLSNQFQTLSNQSNQSNVKRLIDTFELRSEPKVSFRYKKNASNPSGIRPNNQKVNGKLVNTRIHTEIAKEEIVEGRLRFTARHQPDPFPANYPFNDHLYSNIDYEEPIQVYQGDHVYEEIDHIYEEIKDEEDHIYEEIKDEEPRSSITAHDNTLNVGFVRSNSSHIINGEHIYDTAYKKDRLQDAGRSKIPINDQDHTYGTPYESQVGLTNKNQVKKSEKDLQKSIDNFIDNPDFLYFFKKYIESHKESVEKLNVDFNFQTRDIFFLLMVSDAFCQVRDGKNPKVGRKVLYYYKTKDGTKADFLYNKRYRGDALIRVVNKDLEEGSFLNLFSYLHQHCDNSNPSSPVAMVFNISQHIERKNNPDHEINKDEMQCKTQELCDFKAVMDENQMSFENAYRFYRDHKTMLNAELGFDHLREEIKQKSHSLIERIEEKLPSTKIFESNISKLTNYLKDCVSHLFNLLYIFCLAM